MNGMALVLVLAVTVEAVVMVEQAEQDKTVSFTLK